MQSVENEIRQFIIDNFLFGASGDGLSVDDSLIDKGLIDSTGVLELVAFLQTTYTFQIEDHEIVPDNLDSIGKIARFVQGKNSGLNQE